jgi:hypothetical protein
VYHGPCGTGNLYLEQAPSKGRTCLTLGEGSDSIFLAWVGPGEEYEDEAMAVSLFVSSGVLVRMVPC